MFGGMYNILFNILKVSSLIDLVQQSEFVVFGTQMYKMREALFGILEMEPTHFNIHVLSWTKLSWQLHTPMLQLAFQNALKLNTLVGWERRRSL